MLMKQENQDLCGMTNGIVPDNPCLIADGTRILSHHFAEGIALNDEPLASDDLF